MTEIAQVAWAANLATIDFHPWPSRRAHVDNPDELRIDVDPQPGTDFGDAKRVAGLVREVLDEIGYVGWPKTSGNRGIHIACRIEPNWTFPEVRRCALAFAREVEPDARARDDGVVEGGARRARLHRLQPERARPDDRVGVLGARASRRDGLDARDVGRAARRRDGGLHDRDGAEGVRRGSATSRRRSTTT